MKALLINEVLGTTSTGKICAQIAEDMENEGYEVKVAYGRWGTVPKEYQRFAYRIGSNFEVRLHALETRLFDTNGFCSKHATKNFLKWAEEYNPDLLWLHNLHGYYINVEMLFSWIKKHPFMEVRWTLHDCWAFTGHCTHFSAVNCEQWKECCLHCSQLKRYPSCFAASNVEKNFKRKHNAFTGVNHMTLITPSRWLADLTRHSFLKEYPVEVQYNAIDTDIFKPTPSNFRELYHLEDKTILLGVANVWDERKGLYDFFKLSKILDNRYVIVLVGLNGKQSKNLPNNIKTIKHTDSPRELAAIYTAADYFINFTFEDNYPTVNLEAEACGTMVITYDTGGCSETLQDQRSVVIPIGNYERVLDYLV